MREGGRIVRLFAAGRAGAVLRIGRWSAPAVVAGFLLAAPVSSQTHSGFPVDIIAGPAPQPVMADGHRHLVYELHLTNFAPLPIELTRLEISGDSRTALAAYDGNALEDRVVPVELLSRASSPTEARGARTLDVGHAVVIFVDLQLDADVPLPRGLHHRFSFTVARTGKPNFETALDGAVVNVVTDPVPVLSQAPLRGSSWVAFNALGAKDHRRALNAFDGRERIPQRFAIDWGRLGPDGRLRHGKGDSNADYYSYGAEVLAVADGRISDARDGLADNSGATDRSARTITLDNVFGNYVVLDLGNSRFALYAHLQQASLRVKTGDAVKAGQVLALLGNSGNSDAPHLHFQVTDGAMGMGAEGAPYELATFTQSGIVPDPGLLDGGGAWHPDAGTTQLIRHREFPLNNAVINFP